MLFPIEVEFLKVLFLGIFFGYWVFRLLTLPERNNHLREIKHFKFLDLNKKSSLKNKRP